MNAIAPRSNLSRLNSRRQLAARGLRQRGASLVTSLIFLMLITLMAVSASWQGVAQERLASGQRQSSLSLAGADSAARIGERWLYSFYARSTGEALVGSADGSSGIHTPLADNGSTESLAFFSGPTWTDSLGVQVTAVELPIAGADGTAQLIAPPVYLIEDLGALRPSGASPVSEGGGTGGLGYASGGMQPGGNEETRVYRITAKSKSLNDAPVRTVQSVFAGRPKA